MNNVSPSAPDIAIDVKGLTKSFGGRTVVQNLSMQVKRGSIYGFLGPNGSGKTTTIRMLCGLLTPDSGTGRCLGYDIRRDADKIKLRVGYMTQRFSLYQDLSVRENLEFVARLYGLPNPKGAARIRQAVKPRDKFEVFSNREILVEAKTLGHVADQALDLVGVAADVVAEAGALASIRRQQATQHADGGGLAGTVRAEEAKDRAALDLHREIAHHLPAVE